MTSTYLYQYSQIIFNIWIQVSTSTTVRAKNRPVAQLLRCCSVKVQLSIDTTKSETSTVSH